MLSSRASLEQINTPWIESKSKV